MEWYCPICKEKCDPEKNCMFFQKDKGECLIRSSMVYYLNDMKSKNKMEDTMLQYMIRRN